MQMLQADKFIACLVIIIIIIRELLLSKTGYNLISAAAAVCGINLLLCEQQLFTRPKHKIHDNITINLKEMTGTGTVSGIEQYPLAGCCEDADEPPKGRVFLDQLTNKMPPYFGTETRSTHYEFAKVMWVQKLLSLLMKTPEGSDSDFMWCNILWTRDASVFRVGVAQVTAAVSTTEPQICTKQTSNFQACWQNCEK